MSQARGSLARVELATIDHALGQLSDTPSAASVTTTEAFCELLALAERKHAGPLAPALAQRALDVTVGADFAVARDALEALLRRLASAREGGLTAQRVAADRFRVQRRGARGSARYNVWLGDATNLVGSCSCLDYGKASLGMCKHILVVAEPRYGRTVRATQWPALRWDPVRPLTGPGDYLARLWLDPRAQARPRVNGVFQRTAAGGPIDPSCIVDPDRRRAVIERLLAACGRDPGLAEPAVVPLLERELAALGRGLRLQGRELDRLLRGLRRRLFPYQRAGVASFLGSGRLLLADDMGLGKTAQAIAATHALYAAGEVHRVLVVLPAPLKPQWEREWRAFTDVPVRSVDGAPEERARIFATTERGALLVNYEQLLRDLPLVQAFQPELVILDEAQRIKNWETKTAALVKMIDAPWRLVLTGTPMENRLDELASIMEWVDEHALEPRWRLPSWHSVRADGSREVIGARNLDTLRTRLAHAMTRRVRRDVLAQLPPRRDTRVPLPLTDAQQAAHDELEYPIAQLAARARRRPLTHAEFLRLMRLLTQQRMICNGMALVGFTEMWPSLERSRKPTAGLLEMLGSPKLLDLRDRLVDLVVTQERKVVVFSQWRRMLQLAEWTCRDVLARAGVRAMFFTGQESQRRRAENVVAFHDDPDARVLFATDAGGVGLNLQRAASCCINLDLPWNPAVLEQRIGRIYRLGQEQPIEVYNLVAASGIEHRIAAVIGDKRALFTGLFDGTSDEVPFDSSASFMARVHELVRPQIEVAVSDVEDGEHQAVALAQGVDDHDDAAGDGGPIDANASGQERRTPDGISDGSAAVDAGAATREPTPAGRPSALATGAVADAAAPGTAPIVLEPRDLGPMLQQVTVRPLEGGRIALEMPSTAAAALGDLLRALAGAIDGTAAEPAPPTRAEHV